MDTFTVAIVAGIFSLAGTLIATIGNSKGLSEKISSLSQNTKDYKQGLSQEHTGINDTIKNVQATATYLKEDVIRRNGQLEILSKQEHDHAVVAQTSMDILIQDLHNAHKEVAELRQTIQLLQRENARMADQLYGSHVDERFDDQSEDNQMEP